MVPVVVRFQVQLLKPPFTDVPFHILVFSSLSCLLRGLEQTAMQGKTNLAHHHNPKGVSFLLKISLSYFLNILFSSSCSYGWCSQQCKLVIMGLYWTNICLLSLSHCLLSLAKCCSKRFCTQKRP